MFRMKALGALATTADDLSVIPTTYFLGEETLPSRPLVTCVVWQIHIHTIKR